jgi:VWFA-related protein
MKGLLTSFLVIACAMTAGGQQQPVFRGGSEAVRVFVTVLDRDGRLVTDLTQDKFEVRDEGKPQPITQFDNQAQPVRLIVMLDVSSSMQGNLPLLREGAAQLFARLLPADEARVGSFGREVTIAPAFTKNRDELMASLPTEIRVDSPTPLWRGLEDAMTAFGDAQDMRKVILVLSDGKDSGPVAFSRHISSQADVIDRARKEDVMIYAIGMRSRSQRSQPMPGGPEGLQAMLMSDMPDPGLARVAEESGGGYTEIRFGQDLGAAFAHVADELHTQYLLAFAPPKRDGKVHDIAVRVSQSGLKPRARKSYIAPKS